MPNAYCYEPCPYCGALRQKDRDGWRECVVCVIPPAVRIALNVVYFVGTVGGLVAGGYSLATWDH